MKYIFKGLAYTVLAIASPFIWLHRRVKKRNADIKYKHIVDGFSNYAFPNSRMENLAKTRASICSRCPFAKVDPMFAALKDKNLPSIQGYICDACGCNLSAKVRSNDFCPKGKW